MLIQVENLRKRFRTPSGSFVDAVDGVSFDVRRGETVGLVGESGCGKSTVGRCILRLTDPDAGRIVFDGSAIERLSQRQLRQLRQRIQIVFQDPLGSTNPAFSLRQTLGDALRQAGVARDERPARLRALLDSVGLPTRLLDRRRDELSGGQLQRGAIARALAPRPEFMFLDEPTSSLDLSVRGQIINLLADLQDEFGHAYLFASHDLTVVRALAHRVSVMYMGRIVETGPAATILAAPRHPYTQALLTAADAIDVPSLILDDAAPAPSDLTVTRAVQGCRYQPRCPHRHARCTEEPGLLACSDDHQARCWLIGEDNAADYRLDSGRGQAEQHANPSEGVP